MFLLLPSPLLNRSLEHNETFAAQELSSPAAYSSPNISVYHGIIIMAMEMIRFTVIRTRNGHNLTFSISLGENTGRVFSHLLSFALSGARPSTAHHTSL